MDLTVSLFYFVASLILMSATMVVVTSNPLYSALYLVITMVGLSFSFFLLQAPFIASVQLIVYAGAVMVLFVVVLMLIDLKVEKRKLVPWPSRALSAIGVGSFFGLLSGAIFQHYNYISIDSSPLDASQSTLALSKILFSNYLLAFEVMGLLLFVVAVAVVVIARSKGGSHAL